MAYWTRKKASLTMTKVSDLFDLEYGHSLELNKLTLLASDEGINFVGRAARNNGVTARVARIAGIPPANAGTITVALNGQGGAGVAFLQPAPYYTAFHVMILTPRIPMSDREKLWWAMCITANRFRFGFGRQANRTLGKLHLPSPDTRPGWVDDVSFNDTLLVSLKSLEELSQNPPSGIGIQAGSRFIAVEDMFRVEYGTNLELVRLKKTIGGVNFVSRSAKNNGVTARVVPIDTLPPIPGNSLSVAAGGSVLETYVQFDPFYSGRDLYALHPREDLTPEELMFYAACIRANKWRYSYGRQANRTLRTLQIPARWSIPLWVYGTFRRVAQRIALRLS